MNIGPENEEEILEAMLNMLPISHSTSIEYMNKDRGYSISSRGHHAFNVLFDGHMIIIKGKMSWYDTDSPTLGKWEYGNPSFRLSDFLFVAAEKITEVRKLENGLTTLDILKSLKKKGYYDRIQDKRLV